MEKNISLEFSASAREAEGAVKYPSDKLLAVTRISNQIKDLLKDKTTGKNRIVVTDLLKELNEKIKLFHVACNESSNKINNPTDMSEFVKWRDVHISQNERTIEKVKEWFDAVNPEDSASQVSNSRVSEVSRASSLKDDIIRRRVENNVKKSLIKKKLDIEERELKNRIEFERNQIKLKQEMQEAEAKMEDEAIQRLEEELIEVCSLGSSKRAGSSRKILRSHEPSTQVIMQLPCNEPEYFDGSDLTLYKTFLLSFDRIIGQRCNSDTDRFYYLLRYTKGDANRLVQSCHEEDLSCAYREARCLLDKQYGNEYLISHKYLEKLSKWEAIRPEDKKSLSEFSSFLSCCNNMMKRTDSLNQLDSWRDIREILLKLPFDMRKQFRTKAALLVRKNEIVKFDTLVQFVRDQSDILNFPMIGDISDHSTGTEKYTGEASKRRPQRSFYAASDNSSNTREVCHCCKKNNHLLNNCFFFLKKSLKDREEFVRRKKLCYGCLKSDGHVTKDCSERLQCEICDLYHPSSLHRSREDDNIINDNKESSFMAAERNKVVFPTIPVTLFGVNGLKINTYMGLDSFSSSSYMDGSILNLLNIAGKKTTLSITTIENQSTPVTAHVVKNLKISSLDGSVSVKIPKIYAKENWPFEVEDSPRSEDLNEHKELLDIPFDFIDSKIGLLVGMDMPQIIKPLEIIETGNEGPYASKHLLGWALNGPVHCSRGSTKCFRSKTEVLDLDSKFEQCFGSDFLEMSGKSEHSVEEKRWLKKVEMSTRKLPSGKLEISLPFKREDLHMPNNYVQVSKRLNNLRNKFCKNEMYFNEYKNFMFTMRERGFIELVPEEEIEADDGKQWFLTHHGVRHKQKGKLRVVFDCSLQYKGSSLNDELQKGPDLTNTLFGVLLRFRLGKIGVSGDIEKMFYQIHLPESDSNFLRFLWFKNDDFTEPPEQYRLKVHVFGATSSPAVANFALKRSVSNCKYKNDCIRRVITDSFYVDDMLKSFDGEEDAIEIVSRTSGVLAESGFNLTGFSSNSRAVLSSFSEEELSNALGQVNISDEVLPSERALGIKWNTNNDTIGYNVNIPDKPATKRGILSSIFSIYDPLFLASPAIIKAKRLFQVTCDQKLNWDDCLPQALEKAWMSWKLGISHLNKFEVPRWYNCNESSHTTLHVFSDGSEVAYGAVAYLRSENRNGKIATCIVAAKTRLTPLNRSSLKTIPRIELNAAKLAVVLYENLKNEMCSYLDLDHIYFWTDSIATLQYISSESGRFQRFVANRVAYIRSSTDITMWRFIPGNLNPADLLSRGTSDVEGFVNNKVWIYGPEFLQSPEEEWPKVNVVAEVSKIDPEVRSKEFSLATVEVGDSDSKITMVKLFTSTSNLYKLKCRIVYLLRFKNYLLKGELNATKISVKELKYSEICIWKYHQNLYFADVYNYIKDDKPLPKRSCLKKLHPFVDDDSLMRVGGRISRAPVPYDSKHSILLHASFYPVKLLVEEAHRSMGHMGREAMLSVIRERFHIIKSNKLIKGVLRDCVICKKVQGRASKQLMAELPEDRLTGELAPFTNTATDLFGPFNISLGRGIAKHKRYGVLFTCLASRATHIELVEKLDTDSYINALRRFICRRGTPIMIRSDNGTNLTSANKELKMAIKEWNSNQIDEFCKQKEITWLFQPPFASHFGGVFERQIKSIRKILNSLLREFGNQTRLTDEILRTLFCEIENTLNSKPLTVVSTDPVDLDPITPNHLLKMHSRTNYPPGLFSENDCTSRKRWKQAQYLSDVFWYRWRREYIPLLISRQKWLKKERSHKPGDIVLVVDQLLPRNMWCLGRVLSVRKDNYGHVRSADVEVSRCKKDKHLRYGKTVLLRPVDKLVLLHTLKED